MSEYESVQKGSLKLKGVADGGIKKKVTFYRCLIFNVNDECVWHYRPANTFRFRCSFNVTSRFSSVRRFDLAHSICAPFQHLFLVTMAQIITFRVHLKANGT